MKISPEKPLKKLVVEPYPTTRIPNDILIF